MARNLVDVGKIGVGLTAQADITTAATVDSLLDVDRGSVIDTTREVEDDSTEMTGFEGPTSLTFGDTSLDATLSKTRMRPHSLGWAGAFLANNCTSAALSAPDAYRHITVLTDPTPALAYATITELMGASSDAPIDISSFIGCAVNSITVSGSRGGSIDLAMNIVGTGNDRRKKHSFVISGTRATTSLTLNDGTDNWKVAGTAGPTGAQERVDNITVWGRDLSRLNAGDIDKPMVVSVVTDASPSVVTIDGYGGLAGDPAEFYVEFEVDDTQVSPSSYAWSDDLDALTLVSETEMQLKDTMIRLGAGWDDTNFIYDGQIQSCSIESFEWTISRNLEVESCVRTGATPVTYSTNIAVNPWTSTLTVDRRAADLFFNLCRDYTGNNNQEVRFGVSIEMLGAQIPNATAYRYRSLIELPLVQAMESTYASASNKWTQPTTFQVLKDASTLDAPVFRLTTDNGVSDYL